MRIVICFFISGFLSMTLTYLYIRFSNRYNFPMDVPYGYKSHAIHNLPVTTAGGIPIFVTYWLLTSFLVHLNIRFMALFLFSFILLIFGVLDDVKNLRAWLKLAFQAITGLFLYLILQPEGFSLGPLLIPSGIPSLLFTAFFFMVLVNGLNFVDGIDGLAVVYTLVLTIFIYIFYPHTDIQIYSVFIGSLVGFLYWNLGRHRIFLGDAGIYYIAAVISFFVLAPQRGPINIFPFGVVFSIPLMDMGGAVVRRIKRGITPFAPDTEHIHHKLLKKLGSAYKLIVLCIFSSILLGFLGILSMKGLVATYIITGMIFIFWLILLFAFKWV